MGLRTKGENGELHKAITTHGSRLMGGGCMNDNQFMGLRIKFVGRTEWSTRFFPFKKANMLPAKKNKSFARALYLRETIYPYQR